MTAADTEVISVRPGLARKFLVWLQLLPARGIGAIFVCVAFCLLGVLILSTIAAVGLSILTGSISPLVGLLCAIALTCCAPLSLIIGINRVATPIWYAAVEQVVGSDLGTTPRMRLIRQYSADHILTQSEVIGALTMTFAERAQARIQVQRQKSGLRVGMLSID
ncbi:MAG: hypothetical protein ACKVOP_10790 [Sphingomonadaceae bacterium]